uniref:CST complex subunit CTC1 n=1 Tax=Macrostomum lignano TaxID=282301 RepID=A0A1I8I487_9PLAT
ESTPAPDVEPVSLEISLIKPELWSLSDGLIRFRAVSQAECRRVRHRCELRLFNGSAVTAAQVKRCVSRVQTDFAVVAELIDTVNSTILCYKQAGTVNYSLPLFEKFNGDSQILLESLRVLQCAFCLQQLQASEACQRNAGCTRSDRIVSTSLGKVFHFFGRWQRQVCSRNVSCAFSVPGMLDSVQPTDLQLELINSELWLLNGAIQFRAVSEHACHSLRHRCELRLLNGSAVTAVQVKRCVSRVQTDFAVVAELIDTVNSTILCYKQAGTVNYSLPLFEKFNGDSQILLESLRVLQCAFCLQQLQASEACQRNAGCTRRCLEAHRVAVLQLVAVLGVRSAIRRSGFHCEMPPAQRQLCAARAARKGFWRDEAGGSLGAATASSFINYGCSRHHCIGSSGGLLCADEIWSPDDSTGVYVT